MRTYRDYQGHELQPRIYEDIPGAGVSVGSVVFAENEQEILRFTATSQHKLKIKLKEAMEALGVKFENEQRKERTGEN